MKFHTSLLCKGIPLWTLTGCTQRRILSDICQGCHQQEGKDIISLFIMCHGSELPYCCGKQWHFGVLPRRHTIENFVKLGHAVCIGCQRSRKRKGSGSGRHGAWCGPNRMAEYTVLTCQDRVLDMAMLAFCAHTGH